MIIGQGGTTLDATVENNFFFSVYSEKLAPRIFILPHVRTFSSILNNEFSLRYSSYSQGVEVNTNISGLVIFSKNTCGGDPISWPDAKYHSSEEPDWQLCSCRRLAPPGLGCSSCSLVVENGSSCPLRGPYRSPTNEIHGIPLSISFAVCYTRPPLISWKEKISNFVKLVAIR